jgi:hypothetical protein
MSAAEYSMSMRATVSAINTTYYPTDGVLGSANVASSATWGDAATDSLFYKLLGAGTTTRVLSFSVDSLLLEASSGTATGNVDLLIIDGVENTIRTVRALSTGATTITRSEAIPLGGPNGALYRQPTGLRPHLGIKTTSLGGATNVVVVLNFRIITF